MSLPVMFLREILYMSRKGGTGGGGWVHQKDESSMSLWPWKALGRNRLGHFSYMEWT